MNLDYLQIDLDATNGSSLEALKLMDSTIFDTYKFATVTFEHDIWQGDCFDTRNVSRTIFDKRGYVRVFQDVTNEGNPYEDWYVHPSLVNTRYIEELKSLNAKHYKQHPVTGMTIDWRDLAYPT